MKERTPILLVRRRIVLYPYLNFRIKSQDTIQIGVQVLLFKESF
jgi:hypothetical protein